MSEASGSKSSSTGTSYNQQQDQAESIFIQQQQQYGLLPQLNLNAASRITGIREELTKYTESNIKGDLFINYCNYAAQSWIEQGVKENIPFIVTKGALAEALHDFRIILEIAQ